MHWLSTAQGFVSESQIFRCHGLIVTLMHIDTVSKNVYLAVDWPNEMCACSLIGCTAEKRALTRTHNQNNQINMAWYKS